MLKFHPSANLVFILKSALMFRYTYLIFAFVLAAGYAQNAPSRPPTPVQGSIFSTEGEPSRGDTLQVMDMNQENVLLETQTDGNGNFSFSIAPGRYNLYMNGELIHNFRAAARPVTLNLTVEPYLLDKDKRRTRALFFWPLLGLAAGGIAGGILFDLFHESSHEGGSPVSP